MRKPGAVPAPGTARATAAPSSTADLSPDLHLANRSTLAELCPGDIVFLDEIATLRECSAPDFIAVLACPWCGAPGLITGAQFSGCTPIVCTSKNCSGLFRIVNEAQIVPIPPI